MFMVALLAIGGCSSSKSSGSSSPEVPTSVFVVAEDGQSTVSWLPVASATSYNLYYSTKSTVGITEGTKVESVTSPYTLTGLTNGTTYYVVTTAVIAGVETSSFLASAVTPNTFNNTANWWKQNTVFEQIWVSAFQNGSSLKTTATGNTGNLPGITAAINANYFSSLGVNALWLSPIFNAASLYSNSSNKHGYDTIDYTTVSSIFGTNDDLTALLSAAHKKGIRVIFDFVPNHTSKTNAWFVDARSGTSATHRDWYCWNTSDSTIPGDYWWSVNTTNYYWGFFGSDMPELNFRNSDVSSTMKGIAKDWLTAGFDGMRIDAVRYLIEGTTDGSYLDQPETHAWFDGLRSEVVDATYTNGSKMMMAEAWVLNIPTLVSYVKNTSTNAAEFNVVLDFMAPSYLSGALANTSASGAVKTLASHLVTNSAKIQAAGGIFGFFQSNHDTIASRPATSYTGAKLYLTTALNFVGQGMPILYYGNEIAMKGDTTTDLNMRKPFDWTKEKTLESATDSIWQWHQALIHVRANYGAWKDPSIASLTADSGIFAYTISSASAGKTAVVVANLNATVGTYNVTVSGSTVTGLIGSTGADTLSGGTLTVNALPAYGIRVYALDDTSAISAFGHDPVPATY